jgi:hypothetical protein
MQATGLGIFPGNAGDRLRCFLPPLAKHIFYEFIKRYFADFRFDF